MNYLWRNELLFRKLYTNLWIILENVMRWWIFDEWLDELKIFVKNKNSLLKIEFSNKFKKKKIEKFWKNYNCASNLKDTHYY